MKPDVIITWPRSFDYPVWRNLVRQYRDRLNEVVIAWMETNAGLDYRAFIAESMFKDHVLFTQPWPGGENTDWRDRAVNTALQHSLHSEWIWFTEQDFLPMPGFFSYIDTLAPEHDVIGMYEGTRLHPACIFVRRSVLNQTRKNFGIIPGVLDHFGMIQEDIDKLDCRKAIIDPAFYVHMAGLTHNMSLIERGEAPNHNVEQFNEYLKGSINLPVEIDTRYRSFAESYLRTIGAI